MSWSAPKIGVGGGVAGNSITLAEPASIADGDLMVAPIAARGNAAFTLPAGWGLVGTQQLSGNTTANTTGSIVSGLMAWIQRGASAPDLTFVRSGGEMTVGSIIGYTPSTPGVITLADSSAATMGSAGTNVTTAGLTTADTEDLIVAALLAARFGSASAFDATDPGAASGTGDTTTAPTNGTWIERGDAGSTTLSDIGLAIADAVRATAGATGTISAAYSLSARHAMVAGAFTVTPSGGGGVVGDASMTEGGDAVAGAASLALKATLAAPEGADASSAAAKLAIRAAAAITEAGDTSSATGGASANTADMAVTEAADAVSSAAILRIKGASATSEGGDAVTAKGSLAVRAQAALGEAGDAITAGGVLALRAALAAAETDDALAAAGELGPAGPIAAHLNLIEANDAVTAFISSIAEWLPVPLGLRFDQIGN